MITSENVVLQVQFKKLLFHGKVIIPSRDIPFSCSKPFHQLSKKLDVEYIFEYIF